MKFSKRITKAFLVSLLIGFLFNVFHDFVFYNLDPCLKDIKQAVKFEMGQSNDPLCKIHHSLHLPYTLPKEIKITDLPKPKEIKFSYKKPFFEEIPKEIFKPPIKS